MLENLSICKKDSYNDQIHRKYGMGRIIYLYHSNEISQTNKISKNNEILFLNNEIISHIKIYYFRIMRYYIEIYDLFFFLLCGGNSFLKCYKGLWYVNESWHGMAWHWHMLNHI